MSSHLGQVIGGTYRLVRFLAAGGSGDVYEAEHIRLGKAFAVKLLRLDARHTESALKRFRREARAIAKVSSEHVVSIVDCGEREDGAPYLVMELLQGEDLRALLQRERELPARRAVHILCDACSGLAQVHAAGLVHRDIKPENLFITRRASGEDWCKLLDFGVAKMEASQATADGAIIGTVRYMAPEQLADGALVGAATDIHAIGLLLFECLAGRPAYAGQTVQELMYQIMNTEPPWLAELRPELPEAIVSLVRHCLAKTPADRPQSAAELLRLLRGHATLPAASGEATLSDAETVSAALSRKPRMAKGWWALPIAGGLAVGSYAYASLMQRSTTSPEVRRPQPSRVPVSSLPEPVTATAPVVEPSTPPGASAQATPVAPNPSGDARVTVGAHLSNSVSTGSRSASRPQRQEARQLSVGHFDRANPYEE